MTAFVSSLSKGIILVFMYVVFHIDAMWLEHAHEKQSRKKEHSYLCTPWEFLQNNVSAIFDNHRPIRKMVAAN